MGWVHVLFYIMLYSLIDMYNVTIINESINHVSASRICPDSGMLAQWCGFGGAVVCQLRRSHDDD